MNMDLDTLLRDSDPGLVAKTPSSDSPEFERIWNQVNRADTQTTGTPWRTHRILFPTVALALVAAVLLVIVELWPAPGFQPAPSAGSHPSDARPSSRHTAVRSAQGNSVA